MKIVMTGGGSGGHITPILAVAHELKSLRPDTEIIYIGQKGDTLADIPAQDANIDSVYAVSAGKFRRYDDEGWLQFLNPKTQFLNLRDGFKVLWGMWQSYRLLKKLRPAVVFTRGGFVSVPVAYGARLNHIPYITHDSDSTPSLANRLIARGAVWHAVALPAELYPYPPDKTVVVGVPVGNQYHPVSEAMRHAYRQELGLGYQHILLVTGGGNGARLLNEATVANAPYLLDAFPELAIVHLAGRAHEAAVQAAYDSLGLDEARKRVIVYGFVTDLHRYSGAADVVIARGGATNLAEFALQQIACVIVPSEQLGWNVKNAQVLAERGALIQLTEDEAKESERLGHVVGELLRDTEKRVELAQKLGAYAHPHAATDLAQLLLQIAGGDQHVVPQK